MRQTKLNAGKAVLWMWEHTKFIVNMLTMLYILNWVYSCIVIVIAIQQTMVFSYLDTLITETNETFRLIVGAQIVKACVENIFKYNDFGGKGQSYNGDSPIPAGETQNTEQLTAESETEAGKG